MMLVNSIPDTKREEDADMEITDEKELERLMGL